MKRPEIQRGVKVNIPTSKSTTDLTSFAEFKDELLHDGFNGKYLVVAHRYDDGVSLEYPKDPGRKSASLCCSNFLLCDVSLYEEPQRNRNTRTIAAAVAKAIIALDKVSFLRGEDPLSRKTSAARQDLMQALTEAGYELPDPDSSRLRRIQPGQ